MRWGASSTLPIGNGYKRTQATSSSGRTCLHIHVVVCCLKITRMHLQHLAPYKAESRSAPLRCVDRTNWTSSGSPLVCGSASTHHGSLRARSPERAPLRWPMMRWTMMRTVPGIVTSLPGPGRERLTTTCLRSTMPSTLTRPAGPAPPAIVLIRMAPPVVVGYRRPRRRLRRRHLSRRACRPVKRALGPPH